MSSPNPNVASIKNFKNRRVSKTVKFMESDVVINKLTTQQVIAVQEAAETHKGNAKAGLNLMIDVIKKGAPDFVGDAGEQDFYDIPLDELSKLSEEIMAFSGMTAGDSGKA